MIRRTRSMGMIDEPTFSRSEAEVDQVQDDQVEDEEPAAEFDDDDDLQEADEAVQPPAGRDKVQSEFGMIPHELLMKLREQDITPDQIELLDFALLKQAISISLGDWLTLKNGNVGRKRVLHPTDQTSHDHRRSIQIDDSQMIESFEEIDERTALDPFEGWTKKTPNKRPDALPPFRSDDLKHVDFWFQSWERMAKSLKFHPDIWVNLLSMTLRDDAKVGNLVSTLMRTTDVTYETIRRHLITTLSDPQSQEKEFWRLTSLSQGKLTAMEYNLQFCDCLLYTSPSPRD